MEVRSEPLQYYRQYINYFPLQNRNVKDTQEFVSHQEFLFFYVDFQAGSIQTFQVSRNYREIPA